MERNENVRNNLLVAIVMVIVMMTETDSGCDDDRDVSNDVDGDIVTGSVFSDCRVGALSHATAPKSRTKPPFFGGKYCRLDRGAGENT